MKNALFKIFIFKLLIKAVTFRVKTRLQIRRDVYIFLQSGYSLWKW